MIDCQCTNGLQNKVNPLQISISTRKSWYSLFGPIQGDNIILILIRDIMIIHQKQRGVLIIDLKARSVDSPSDESILRNEIYIKCIALTEFAYVSRYNRH